MKEGLVYILSNPSFRDNYYKIGMTTREAEDRAWEIYVGATGVPEPFEVEYTVFSKDCHASEKEVHRLLSGFRVNDSREFFRVGVADAIKVIERVVANTNSSIKAPGNYREDFPDRVEIINSSSGSLSGVESTLDKKEVIKVLSLDRCGSIDQNISKEEGGFDEDINIDNKIDDGIKSDNYSVQESATPEYSLLKLSELTVGGFFVALAYGMWLAGILTWSLVVLTMKLFFNDLSPGSETGGVMIILGVTYGFFIGRFISVKWEG